MKLLLVMVMLLLPASTSMPRIPVGSLEIVRNKSREALLTTAAPDVFKDNAALSFARPNNHIFFEPRSCAGLIIDGHRSRCAGDGGVSRPPSRGGINGDAIRRALA